MIERRCLQGAQQATREADLVRISEQTEEDSHEQRSEKAGPWCGQGSVETFRTTPREHAGCSSVLGEALFNGYWGQLITNSVYRLEENGM